MQENLIKNAVQFLKNPKVSGTDKEKLVQFLKGKGLNDEEIKEAFKRVDSPSVPSFPPSLESSAAPPKPFSSPVSSSFLNQSNKSLSSFPDLRAYQSLKLLLLSHNQLTQVPPEIISLTTLEVLDLSFNKLKNDGLPKCFFSLFSLKVLNLGFNNLTSLFGFANLVNLEKLFVNNNEILEIPEELGHLPLQVLILSFNQIKKVPGSLFLNSDLSKVVLVGNPLPDEVLKASFESISKLKSLLV